MVLATSCPCVIHAQTTNNTTRVIQTNVPALKPKWCNVKYKHTHTQTHGHTDTQTQTQTQTQTHRHTSTHTQTQKTQTMNHRLTDTPTLPHRQLNTTTHTTHLAARVFVRCHSLCSTFGVRSFWLLVGPTSTEDASLPSCDFCSWLPTLALGLVGTRSYAPDLLPGSEVEDPPLGP